MGPVAARNHMRGQVGLGRVMGVEVRLHYSWFVIALLITFSLIGHFRSSNPDWGTPTVWASALVAAALFFASLLLHELSHAAVARSRGLPVRSITLFALGGVATIEREASDPQSEFWMAIVGPITSIVIGAACLGLALPLGWSPGGTPDTAPAAILMWLGWINVGLAVFNMIPGYPLDGGRVLRALVWWRVADQARATRLAARVGQLVALSFIALGLWRVLTGAGIGGLWLAFIGWFLMDAARGSYAQLTAREMLRDLRVRDVMTRDCATVDRRLGLRTFVEDYLLRTGRRCFFVQDDGRIAGLVTPHEVKAVGSENWPTLTVGEVMKPLDKVRSVDPEAPASDALDLMSREDVNQVPVVRDGRLEGAVTRGYLLHVLQTRSELTLSTSSGS